MKGISLELPQNQWKTVFLIGSIAAFLSFAAVVFDIVFGSLTSANLSQLPDSASERFVEFSRTPLIGLYHLDLLNAMVALIMLPTYFALVGIHRARNCASAIFASMVYFLGTAMLVSANAALPMLELSGKYLATTDASQRQLFTAAGEALLSRGAHGSIGNLFGFVLSELAGIGISMVMFRGRLFGKVIPLFGLTGGTLLLAYTILITFVPSTKAVAVMVAAPGGLLSIVWTVGIGVVLMKEYRSAAQ